MSSHNRLIVVSALLISWTFSFTRALPTGAPSTACVSMYPQHPGPAGPASAQSGLVVPFQIQVAPIGDTRAYSVKIVRNPNFPGAPSLLGFFLQVRDPNSNDPLGEWKNLPVYARVGDCTGANTVTHVANAPKSMEQGLEFTWEPTNLPANTKSLQILGTFVQNMQTFWVKVPSQIFTLKEEEPQAPVRVAPSVNDNAPAVVPGSTSFGTTDAPISSVNHNNIDSTNNRQPGFGNSAAAGSSPVNNPNQPQPTIRINNNDGVKALAGFFTTLAALVIAL
ncbi:hypothetical protein BV898_17472 [Hypsibius exemplaris]|uniref:Reelin domain-containing protein n=1 Tax=Hypsibius exemplaris TaxID=2072580 RepID=A0A9X6NMC4_HYPEX|nr:hypothetical protein BV898_17472 [Hypsibius exemplaris]